MLTLTGGGFSQSVEYCRFSTSSLISPPVLARWLSETRVECVAPRSERTNDMASLEISINGQQFTSSGFDFAYLPDIELLDLEPPQGPMQGGSMLTIRGNHLHDLYNHLDSLVICRFNVTMSMPAVMVSINGEDLLQCITPSASQEGSVTVRISSNGQDISNDLRFEYVDVHLISASPPLGPLTGGTAVLVSGVHLPVGSVICRFGPDSDGIRVPATTDSSSSVVCTSPQREAGAGRVGLKDCRNQLWVRHRICWRRR